MLSTSPYDHHELLQKVALGNAGAFRELFSRHQHAVYAYSLRITHSVCMAEDITQEVFLKLWLHREKLTELENVEAWIITIARNLCFNQLKKTAREKCIIGYQPEEYEGADVVSIEQKVEQRDLLVKLREASAQLTPKEQLVYRLNKEQGLRKEEIAQALNISHNTVKAHLTNALRKMRHYMEGYSAAGLLVLCIVKLFFKNI